MFKNKRMLAVGLTAMLGGTLALSGCSSNNNANNASNQPAPAEESSNANAPAAETKNEPVELIWYTIGTPQKDTDKVMAEVSKYTADKIGVTVKMTQLDWGDYSDKMKVLTASGTPMDILFTSSWAFDYVQNARKGAFLAIDDLLKSEGQGIQGVLDPAFLEGSKVEGHNYGIPANKELPALEVWRFNKTLVDKHGLDTSNVFSLESLEPLLKTIKEQEPDVVPFALNKDYMPVVPYDYLISNLPMAVKLDTTVYKVVNILDTPEMKQALKTMRAYYKAGYVSPEAATITSLDDVQKAGKWFIDRAATTPFADNQWSASLGYPVVSTPASESVVFNWSVMGSMQAISANSKHPEEAMKFLNLVNTDPVLRNMIDSGIEGTHYKMAGDNRMENLPDSKNYDMPTFSLGNVMLTFLNPGDPDNKWDEYKSFNGAGKPAPTLGFNFDASSVTNELAAIQNVKGEFWAALMTGTVDPDEYLPKAIEKFNAAGLDKIIAEAQKQLDAWRASK
ncbi:putative aldouronate transport system substrate-binding protein [Paenibacillus phyllosphaerae]|uniref:Putative aldouronate transport system substrate-binding protein n=1 Tax=Paenibacillus phyllosphaerae TaxID=274593 RepID=A0A7W5AVM0_9BACL|nr:ABC transporter substrate-binding protein [Paenibacillus phyllosphaerae]MBB3109608.1 putative aldouronate transport system substrate-binding protein [Paenibacillus phyllosphaerae]